MICNKDNLFYSQKKQTTENTANPSRKTKISKCQQKGQKTIILIRRILRPLRAMISTRVDTSAILTSRAITGTPEAFNEVGLF